MTEAAPIQETAEFEAWWRGSSSPVILPEHSPKEYAWLAWQAATPTVNARKAAEEIAAWCFSEPGAEEVERIAALILSHTGSPAAGLTEDERRDAARWRALISCGHLRMMGWAGFDKDGAPNKEHLHFGMEAWSHPHINLDDEHARMCKAQRDQALVVLVNFVDRLTQAQVGK